MSPQRRLGLLVTGGLCTALAAVLPGTAMAGSISPSSVSASIGVGDVLKVVKTVFTDAGAGLVNFLFLADNTGSMGGVINNVKTVSSSLLSSLASAYPGAQFAVARYFGDPSEGGVGFGSNSYGVLQTMTSNTAAVGAAIGNWIASGGGDTPEAGFYALQQAVSDGASTCPGLGSGSGCGGSGDPVNWDPAARKVILQFGDATSHQQTVTMNNAIAALNAGGAAYIALNSVGPTVGLDGNFPDGGQAGNQASTVAAAIPGGGGVVIDNFASVPIPNIVSTIESAVGTVTSNYNLSLAVASGNTSGLGITFSCTDPLGCTGVPGGESRTFEMAITGVTPGTYDFTVVSPGVRGAVETDSITVGSPSSVPGPLPVLGTGLAFGWSRRLRKRIGDRRPLRDPIA